MNFTPFTIFAKHLWLSAVIVVTLTIISAIGFIDPYLIMPRATKQPGPAQVSPVPQNRRAAPNVVPSQLFASEVIMVVTSDDFFTPAGAQSLRTAVEALEELPQVSRVMWFDLAPPLNIFGLRQPVLPDHRATLERFKLAREDAAKNPLIAGQLLSRDGKTALLLISLDWFYVRSDADCTSGLRAVAEQAAAKIPDAKLDFAVTGETPMRMRIKANTHENDRKFQWIAFSAVLVMACVLFRGLSAVIISALAPALGIFWTLGCLRYFHLEENPFNTVVVPILLAMVGFTDGVHMMTEIRKHRASGLSGFKAAEKALNEVGLACFLTSLTTAVSFASLGWAHHQVVREFGWCCVMGVSLTFLAVVVSLPLGCASWLGKSVHQGRTSGGLEKDFHRLVGIINGVLKAPRLISILAFASTAICGLSMLGLRPDERQLSALPEKSEEVKALRHMDKAFGGLETAQVSIYWHNDLPDISPEVVEVSDAVEKLLRSEPSLGSPLGIAGLIDAMPGDRPAAEKHAMLDLLPPPLKRAFIRPEQHRLEVVFRLQDVGIATYGPVFERINAELTKIAAAHPGFSLSLEGDAVWRWRHLYRVILDLAKSLSTASIIIFGVLGIAYRSVRLGLISIVPNIFPLVVTGTWMYFIGWQLELVSVLAFTIALGIAVDDTIHFLTRYCIECKRCSSQAEAIRQSFIGVGAAMVMTTVVLICGFATVYWSDTHEHHVFAIMSGSTIAFALVGDIFFLPALLFVFDRGRCKNTSEQKEPT